MTDNLSEAQFHQYKRTSYRIEPGTFPRSVHAYVASTGKQVGYLGWDGTGSHVPERQRNALSDVTVLKAHRGRGVASAMLGYARGLNPEIKHSQVLTPDGKVWSAKTPLPT